MLNQIIVVGRISDIVVGEHDDFYTVLKVPRSYKSENGEYKDDFIKVFLPGNIGANTKEYCVAGDLIGVNGRIENPNNIANEMILVAEKVTFLSNARRDTVTNEEEE